MRRSLLRPVLLAVGLVTACDMGQPGAPVGVSATNTDRFCPLGTSATDPMSYGLCAVAHAASQTGQDVSIDLRLASDPGMADALREASIVLRELPESYASFWRGGRLLVVGRDPVGAMYGALEVVDELAGGQWPRTSTVVASPVIALRAANLFLTLPADGETAWWFLERSFWTEYLDMMARARLDYLDLHGMYDLDSTNFPNALLWFGASKSFPAVGVPSSERARNVAMLNEIVSMARVRGIKVGLMSYESTLDLTGKSDKTTPVSELTTYTHEAILDLLANVHGLDYLGFRVGESGEPPSFYETFVASIAEAHTSTRPASRTWGTTKEAMLPLIDMAGPDILIEAKMNGEHLGVPYVLAGGRMARWSDYSYEEFLDPEAPYKFVFQVRTGGTHRIFRYASYERTRRTVLSLATSPRVLGFTFEAAHAYLPQRDFYHANPEDSFSPWTFRRDELAYLLFGRLGYDPTTPDRVFRAALAERVGTPALWDAVQSASEVVPWILTGNACGPDQRGDAPELELGGPVDFWASPADMPPPPGGCPADRAPRNGHGPFDTFAVASPYDTATDLAYGRGTSRVSSVDVALTVLGDAAAVRQAVKVHVDPDNVEARDVVRECNALADLGDWYAHKLASATALAVYEQSGKDAWLDAALHETRLSVGAFSELVTDTGYIAPFDENMRMTPLGIAPFHWKAEAPIDALDVGAVNAVGAAVKAKLPSFTGSLPDPTTWLGTARGPGVGLVSLEVTPMDPRAASWTVTATFAHPVPPGANVDIQHRPWESDAAANWQGLQAAGSGAVFSAVIAGTGRGGMFAVEVVGPAGVAHRYPDPVLETPYVALPP